MARTIKDKIYELLGHGESVGLEFKSAKGGFPGSFWESYSAFANTDGGIIVLGVKESEGRFILDGMTEETAQKYLKEFWDCANNRNKVSMCLPKEDDVRFEEIDGSYLLICHIPRANYEFRPVHLTHNPFGNTYRRNHEGDYRCSDAEIRRMFADAEHTSHPQDAVIKKGLTIEQDIDLTSLHEYRQLLASLHPTHPWGRIMDDMQFMEKIGAFATDVDTGERGITRAGLLMFGKSDRIRNVGGEPYYFVDYREQLYTEDPRIRWTDRVYPDGTWEANLFQFYVRVYNKLIQALPRPFKLVDGVRRDETAAHDAVREALVNAIIHQDLNAMGNIVIVRSETEITFSNPGIMLVSKEQYFKGGRSICRNPTLQNMFMMIGRAEKAGSGVDKILLGWEELGWDRPFITEESQPDYVILTLPIGRRNRQEKPPRKTAKKNRQEKPPRSGSKADRRMDEILAFCGEPRAMSEILSRLGMKNRENLRTHYLVPLISSGRLVMTEPDTPNSRNQKYVTTQVNTRE